MLSIIDEVFYYCFKCQANYHCCYLIKKKKKTYNTFKCLNQVLKRCNMQITASVHEWGAKIAHFYTANWWSSQSTSEPGKMKSLHWEWKINCVLQALQSGSWASIDGWMADVCESGATVPRIQWVQVIDTHTIDKHRHTNDVEMHWNAHVCTQICSDSIKIQHCINLRQPFKNPGNDLLYCFCAYANCLGVKAFQTAPRKTVYL